MMTNKRVQITMGSISIFAVLFTCTLANQFQIDPKLSEEWLKRAQNNFKPETWDNSVEMDSLEQFLDVIDRNEEVYAFFHNRQDNGTFSLSPFFKTTSMSLRDTDGSFPVVTADLTKLPELAAYYGIPSTHSIIFYFYHKSPIVLKFDQVEKSPRPLEKWIKRVKELVQKVPVIASSEDLEIFENSSKLKLLIVDKQREALTKMFAALSFNYLDLDFAYLIRDASMIKLERDIEQEFELERVDSGSRVCFEGPSDSI